MTSPSGTSCTERVSQLWWRTTTSREGSRRGRKQRVTVVFPPFACNRGARRSFDAQLREERLAHRLEEAKRLDVDEDKRLDARHVGARPELLPLSERGNGLAQSRSRRFRVVPPPSRGTPARRRLRVSACGHCAGSGQGLHAPSSGKQRGARPRCIAPAQRETAPAFSAVSSLIPDTHPHTPNHTHPHPHSHPHTLSAPYSSRKPSRCAMMARAKRVPSARRRTMSSIGSGM